MGVGGWCKPTLVFIFRPSVELNNKNKGKQKYGKTKIWEKLINTKKSVPLIYLIFFCVKNTNEDTNLDDDDFTYFKVNICTTQVKGDLLITCVSLNCFDLAEFCCHFKPRNNI